MKRKIFSILFALVLALGFSLMVVPAGAISGTTWYVDPTGTDDGTHGAGLGTDAFQTIQYAIDDGRVAGGDTILVAAGTYDVATLITVNKAVAITGPESGSAIVRGTTADDIRIFKIVTSDVTIKNLEITVASLGAYNSSVSELDNSLVGISDSALSNVSVENNILYVPLQSGPMSGWNARAITVGDSSSANVIITNNTIYNVRNGIVVRTGNTATVTNNIIFNTKGGIMNYTSNQVDANNRTVTGNLWASTVSGVISHNEWDIVWNTAWYVPDYQQSVVGMSSSNNDAYVLDRRAADAAACANLTGNRSHIFVDAASIFNAAHPARGNFNEPFSSISLGVDAVVPGGTVNVAAGEYDEQVVITKSLTLQGAGDTTIIKPSSADKLTTVLDGIYGGGTKQIAGIIVADEADTVTVNDLKVDGEGVTACPIGADYVTGIFYRETGGTIDTVSVEDMTIGVTGTAVRGYGIYLSAGTNTVSVEIDNSTIINYDKNGINAHGDKLTADIHDNIITGRGPLPSGDEVQNGVLIMDSATGTVNINTISNMAYIPETWWSAGIMFYEGSGSADNNPITDCQIGVIYQDGDGTAEGNIINGGTVGICGLWAQYTKADTWTVSFAGNTVISLKDSILPWDGAAIGAQTWNAGASLAVTIDDNELTGGGATNADGIYIGDVPAAIPAGSITATITNNTVSGWQEGIRLVSSVAPGTTITGNTITNNIEVVSGIHIEAAVDASNVIVNFNNIMDNALLGINNEGTGTLDATNNWWGDKSGPQADPGQIPDGENVSTGDKVSDYVHYDPWIGAEVTVVLTQTGASGEVDGTDEADTWVYITGGTADVSIAKYGSNPGSGFSGDTGKYVDVMIQNLIGVTEIEIRLYYTNADIAGKVESSLALRWWDGANWVVCSDSGVNTTDIPAPPPAGVPYSGYMWAKIRNDTTPNLTQLTGTPFGGGGVAPLSGGGGPPPSTLSKVGSVSLLQYIDWQGRTRIKIILRSDDGVLTIIIFSATLVHNAGGNPLENMGIVTLATPPPPPGYVLVGHAYDCLPGGANFAPKVTMTFAYDPADIPDGVNENDMLMAYWDGGKWINLPTAINAAANTATGGVEHFTPFALMAYSGLASFSASNLSIQPLEVQPTETVTITLSVANTGDTEGSYSVVLKINGAKEAEKSITVAAGSSESVAFSVTREEAGSYSVAVDGLTGSFTVVVPAPAPPPAPPAPPEAKPPINWMWIGIIAAVVVVGLIIFFMVRRRAY